MSDKELTAWKCTSCSHVMRRPAPRVCPICQYTVYAPVFEATEPQQPAPVDLPPALADARVRFWMCNLHDRGRVEWRGEVAHCLEPGCGRSSADPGPAAVRDRAALVIYNAMTSRSSAYPLADVERFADATADALAAAGLLAAEPVVDRLARALHDADCGCGDYDQDEDPRYITAARAALAAEPTGEPEAVEGMQELKHGGGLKVAGASIFLEGHVTVRDEDTGVHASAILTADEMTSLRDALTAYLQDSGQDTAEPTGGTT